MENIIADKFLFDKTRFRQELGQEAHPLPLFKRTLKTGYEYLTEQFKSGENIELIIKKQSWLIDQLLILAWQRFINSDEFSLIAVGGYGRSELLLASDIDLMVLEKPRTKKVTKHQLIFLV